MDQKVKSILISQPEPTDGVRSPYYDLKDKFKVVVHFRPFTHVEGIPSREFRKDKVNLLDYTGIILASKASVENLFRIIHEMRIELSAETKFFCFTEAIALYLQKYITYRKRKVFYPKTRDSGIKDIILKHKEEKYLFPCASSAQNEILEVMKKHKLKCQEAVLYKTVSSDLSDLADVNYDIIAFFNPAGIVSLFENFPDFKQNNTRIAAFGSTTCQAVLDAGLTINIQAPAPGFPSMKMALEDYIRKANK